MAGHRSADAAEEARRIAAVRLAVWGEAADVERHMRALAGEDREAGLSAQVDEWLAILGTSRDQLESGDDGG